MRVLNYFMLALLCCMMLAGCGSAGGGDAQMSKVKRVLFVGNSYTFMNGGIENHLKGMAPGIETLSISASGFTLEQHWENGRAVREIQNGGWDVVVLQEQSQRPVLEPKLFQEYVGKFDAEVRKKGGRTVLLMTWENAAGGVTTPQVAAAYRAVARALGITVAPAGEAFARALQEKPTLPLYVPDGHPTITGTYLAACVVYATVLSTSPVGNPYAAQGLSAELRGFLQGIAAKTVGV